MLESSMKTDYRNRKALMKISQSSPFIEGLTDESGKVIVDSKAIQKHILDFFKNKYDDKDEKIIFKDILPKHKHHSRRIRLNFVQDFSTKRKRPRLYPTNFVFSKRWKRTYEVGYQRCIW